MSQPKEARPCYLSKHGFEFDLFFSYSHGDILDGGNAPLKRWSIQLYEALAQTLALLLRPAPRIFLDESTRLDDAMDPAAHLVTSLMAKVEKSAMFQIVMSPHYLESKWCLRELETFVSRLPDQAKGVDGRIFIAKAMETAGVTWPAPLLDEEGNKTKGWEFHPRGRPLPYGFLNDWRGSPPSEVSETLIEMAVAIQRQLCTLDASLTEKQHQAVQVQGLKDGNIEKIYLYGREDEADAWEATWKEIDTLGISVTPGEPESLDAEDDADKRLQYARLASRCDAMLMVGSNGLKLDFDLDVIGRERRNFIHSTYQKYLPCAVVDRRGDLKRTAREGNAKRFGIDWIDAHSGAWPDAVRVWLQDSAGKVSERYGLPPPPPDEYVPTPEEPEPVPQ